MDITTDLGWPAPAKLNRFLRITGRRPDGYHTLQTVFQFLDQHDLLRFEADQPGVFRQANPIPGITSESDLCVRAARLLAAHCSETVGVTIHLDKRLPIGAGLGGGSSDAATTLIALNTLWRLNLSGGQLAQIGLELGADVPVFVFGQAAWAEGVGEQLTAVTPDEPWFLVLVPGCQVPTEKIFRDSQLTRNSEPLTIRPDLELLGNDCEAVVFRRFPQVAAAAQWLGAFASARLTGTGACLFARFDSRSDAQAVLEKIPEGGDFSGFVSRGCNNSLLHDRLRKAKMAACDR